ncbi:MAG: hypothetical protein HY320_10870 [Armatimonadetes bacterium]|nr:hypothetical protein [Armatimonadota bacterium]
MPVAEILVAGDEILSGQTQDVNSFWLCRALTARGVFVRRVVQVRDDETAIAAEVAAARAGRANLRVCAAYPINHSATTAAVPW